MKRLIYLLRRTLYYGIFFGLSGIIHIYLCVDFSSNPTPSKLEIRPTEAVTLSPGAKQLFNLKVYDKSNKEIKCEVKWTATGGKISDKGEYVAGEKIGKYTVQANEPISNISSNTVEVKIVPMLAIVSIPKVTPPPPEAKNTPPEVKEQPEEKKTPPPNPPQKKEEVQPNKEEMIKYRENLEKALKAEWQMKMEEAEKLRKEQEKILQQKLDELQNLKKEIQESQQRELEKMKKENEEKIQAKLTQLDKDHQQKEEEAAKKRQQDLEQIKKENEEKLQLKLTQLANDYQKKEKESVAKSQQELQQIKEMYEKSEKQSKENEKRLKEKAEELVADNKKQKQELENKFSQEMISLKQKNQREMEKIRESHDKLKKDLAQKDEELTQKSEELEKKRREDESRLASLEKEIIQQKRLLEEERKRMMSETNTSPTVKQARERELINKQWKNLEKVRPTSFNQYKDYINKFTTDMTEGVTVPTLDFFDKDFSENIEEVMRFHRMEMVAFPESREYFISVDLNKNKESGRFRKRTDIEYFKIMSNRAVLCNEIYPEIIREIKNDPSLYNRRNGSLSLVFVFPHSTANYFAWKSLMVCKHYGYDPKDVLKCNAIFRKNKVGYWSLRVQSLTLKDGKGVPVSDFEEKWST